MSGAVSSVKEEAHISTEQSTTLKGRFDETLTLLSNAQMFTFTAAGAALLILGAAQRAEELGQFIEDQGLALDAAADFVNNKVLFLTGILDIIFDAKNLICSLIDFFNIFRDGIVEKEVADDEHIKKLKLQLILAQNKRKELMEQAFQAISVKDIENLIDTHRAGLVRSEIRARCFKVLFWSFVFVRSLFGNLTLANNSLMVIVLGSSVATSVSTPALLGGMLVKALIHAHAFWRVLKEMESNQASQAAILQKIKEMSSQKNQDSAVGLEIFLLEYAKRQDDYLVLRQEARMRIIMVATYLNIVTAAAIAIGTDPFIGMIALSAALFLSCTYLIAVCWANHQKKAEEKLKLTTKEGHYRSALHRLQSVEAVAGTDLDLKRRLLSAMKENVAGEMVKDVRGSSIAPRTVENRFRYFKEQYDGDFAKLEHMLSQKHISPDFLQNLHILIQRVATALVEMKSLIEIEIRLNELGLEPEWLGHYEINDSRLGFILRDKSFTHLSLGVDERGLFNFKQVLTFLDGHASKEIGENVQLAKNYDTMKDRVERASSRTGWVHTFFSAEADQDRKNFHTVSSLALQRAA